MAEWETATKAKSDDWESAPARAVTLRPGLSVPQFGPEPKSASTAEFILNSAKKGVGNFASLPGMIVDLLRPSGADDLRDAGRLPPKGPGLGAMAQSGWDQLLGADREMKAPGTASRLAGKAVEFGVSGAPFSARTIANAPNALRALWAEVGSAAGGGVGSELGGDVGAQLGSRGTGEFVGGLVGGVAGLATPVAVDKAVSLIAPRISASGREQAVRRIADNRLSGALNANLSTGQNLDEAARTTSEVNRLALGGESGGRTLRPTIGQSTGAPGVIDIEQSVARGSPEDLGRYDARMQENRAAVDAAKAGAFPEGGSVTRGASNTVVNVTRALDSKLDELAARQESLAASMPNMSQQDVGVRLQTLRDQAQNVARSAKNGKVNDLYATADRLGVSESMDEIVATVRGLGKSDENVYQTMPPVFGKILREHGKEMGNGPSRAIPPDLMAEAGIGVSKPASFKELHSLWRETNSQLASAQRTGDNNAAYYLATLKDSLGQKLSKFEEQGFGELSAKFKDFNKWFSTKYAPAFYEGVGGKMNAHNRYGDLVAPEKVTGTFFTPSGIDDFHMITTQLPDDASRLSANTALKDGIVGLFRQKAVKDGRINPEEARNFIRKHSETLDKVPDIKLTLSNPSTATQAIADRAANITKAQREIDGTLLGKIAKSDDPAAVIQGALSNPKQLMALVASARDPSSQRAILRGIADGIPKAAQRAKMDPLQFVLTNESTLRPVLDRLGKGHFQNLRTIASAETMLGRTQVPQHAGSEKVVGAIEEMTGSTPRTILSQSGGVAAGRQGPMYAISHLLSRFGIKQSEERIANVMREVIYNPELAQQLSTAARQPVTVAASNRVMEHLMNAGIRVSAEQQE